MLGWLCHGITDTVKLHILVFGGGIGQVLKWWITFWSQHQGGGTTVTVLVNRSLFICHYRFRRAAHLDLILVTRSLLWTWKWGEGKGQFLHLLPKLNSEKSIRGHSAWGAGEMVAYLVKCWLSKYEVLSSDPQHPSKSQAQQPWPPHTCPCVCTGNKQTKLKAKQLDLPVFIRQTIQKPGVE